MKKIIKLTEADLYRIVGRIINESDAIDGDLELKDNPELLSKGYKVYEKKYDNYRLTVTVGEITKEGKPMTIARVSSTFRKPDGSFENFVPAEGTADDISNGYMIINGLDDPKLIEKYIPMVREKAESYGQSQNVSKSENVSNNIAGDLELTNEKNGVKLYAKKYNNHIIKVYVIEKTNKKGEPITLAKVEGIFMRPDGNETYIPTEGTSDDISNGFIIINGLNDPKLINKYIKNVRNRAKFYRQWDDAPQLKSKL